MSTDNLPASNRALLADIQALQDTAMRVAKRYVTGLATAAKSPSPREAWYSARIAWLLASMQGAAGVKCKVGKRPLRDPDITRALVHNQPEDGADDTQEPAGDTDLDS